MKNPPNLAFVLLLEATMSDAAARLGAALQELGDRTTAGALGELLAFVLCELGLPYRIVPEGTLADLTSDVCALSRASGVCEPGSIELPDGWAASAKLSLDVLNCPTLTAGMLLVMIGVRRLDD